MSDEVHEELSPLHRLMSRVKARREADEERAELTRNPFNRSEAEVRVATYRLVEAEVFTAITEVAKDQVDRIVAARRKP